MGKILNRELFILVWSPITLQLDRSIDIIRSKKWVSCWCDGCLCCSGLCGGCVYRAADAKLVKMGPCDIDSEDDLHNANRETEIRS
ncbi:hypothetical protein F2Q70_00025190 [Brassica cretica]|uniref:Uncharacterized protein n=1 Tax=Brassica cretica TaxID=69181 RepID=A0A8S9I991_BRACR|nr:hypothetical protein F2Q68_00024537 [Brassica cretica]KAF2604659.1 hypothetical protein F2Q70_00025190 [Brassica cretica]